MKKEINFLATENTNIHSPKTITIEFPDFAHIQCIFCIINDVQFKRVLPNFTLRQLPTSYKVFKRLLNYFLFFIYVIFFGYFIYFFKFTLVSPIFRNETRQKGYSTITKPINKLNHIFIHCIVESKL